MQKQSVFIIGAAGRVGSTAAYALIAKGIARDIVLIDTEPDRLQGQLMDLAHAAAFTADTIVRVGDFDEIRENDIVVVASGLSMSGHGVSNRLELLGANLDSVTEVAGKIKSQDKSVYLLVVTNPVDVMTAVALKVSGLPKERVLGTGTLIDSARLRYLIAEVCNISTTQVDALALGEHGESSFPVFSRAKIDGKPLAEYPGFDDNMADGLIENLHSSGHKIAQAKGVSNYGTASAIATIVEALRSEKGSVLPVCTLVNGEYDVRDVVVSLPALVSSKGVRPLGDYPLTDDERRKLRRSAEVVRKNMKATIQN